MQEKRNNMLEKIRKWIKRIVYKSSHDYCYDMREAEGIAVFGMCSGVVGGDRGTGYLAWYCVDCPYLVLADDDA